jgi:hypothetical protein
VAFGTWRAWQPGADGTSEETRAERSALDLVGTAQAALTVEDDMLPVADAGLDRTVAVGTTVRLDGTGSLEPRKGMALVYIWTIVSAPAGSAAALDDAGAIRPSFVADLSGDYVIELVVENDKAETSSPDQITVSTNNSAPVADAGPDLTVALGNTVILDASASSDLDGDEIAYSWSLVESPLGSGATLPRRRRASPLTPWAPMWSSSSSPTAP